MDCADASWRMERASNLGTLISKVGEGRLALFHEGQD